VVADDDDITEFGDEQVSNCSVFTWDMMDDSDWLGDWEGFESSRYG